MKKQVQIKTLYEGRDVSATGEQTILQVALENGIKIPRLCYVEGLSQFGACRLCMVEIKGSNKLLPACVTQVQEGMEVTVHSERLDNYRKLVLKLLFSDKRNHICSVCVVDGLVREWPECPSPFLLRISQAPECAWILDNY